MRFEYIPKGTCSKHMVFEIDGDIIQSVEVTGGCNGNLKGIASLLKGMDIHEVINRLSGTTCGPRNTSCPDQISKGLQEYLNQRQSQGTQKE